MSEKKRVLVIDDKAANVALLIGMLRTEYEVLVAKDGEKGLALASGENQPGLILLDIQMPDMDGFEVCRRLKTDPSTAEIPVVFITATGDEASESKGFELGAVDFLNKPFSPHIVHARVKAHIRSDNDGGTSSAPAVIATADTPTVDTVMAAFKRDLIDFIDSWSPEV